MSKSQRDSKAENETIVALVQLKSLKGKITIKLKRIETKIGIDNIY
jgi:hypothetical protein